jgi:uncharacterized protein
MALNPQLRCTAFAGLFRIATGELRHVAMKAKQAADTSPQRRIRVFDDATGRQLALPLELSAADLLTWLSQAELARPAASKPRRKPGRPKLGVVPREITLLPEHWDWLAAQPGGASLVLRRLVDQARSISSEEDRQRAAQEAAYQFMQVMAADEAQREAAARALFAGDINTFEACIQHWPDDIRDHLALLASDAFLG